MLDFKSSSSKNFRLFAGQPGLPANAASVASLKTQPVTASALTCDQRSLPFYASSSTERKHFAKIFQKRRGHPPPTLLNRQAGQTRRAPLECKRRRFAAPSPRASVGATALQPSAPR